MQDMQVWSLGGEDPLEKEMATHSSILAWKTPWPEESGELQSMGHKESDMTDIAGMQWTSEISVGGGGVGTGSTKIVFWGVRIA